MKARQPTFLKGEFSNGSHHILIMFISLKIMVTIEVHAKTIEDKDLLMYTYMSCTLTKLQESALFEVLGGVLMGFFVLVCIWHMIVPQKPEFITFSPRLPCISSCAIRVYYSLSVLCMIYM